MSTPNIPPGGPKNSSELELQIQSQFNELRSNLLDDRATYINRWLSVIAIVLTFFGIVVAIVGFIAFDRFQEFEIEAKDILKEIRSTLDQSQQRLQNIDAEIVKNDPAKAVQVVEDIRANPDSSLVENAIAQALALQREGNEEESAEIWRAIASIAEDKDNSIASNAWFSIGFLIETKNPEEALLAYDRAIHLKPDYAHAYKHRGIVKDFLKRHDEAIADYDEAIRLQPDFAEAYTYRGHSKDDVGRHDEAITDLDIAIRLMPDFAPAYNNRGIANSNLNRYDEAIADYDEAIRLRPEFNGTYMNRGNAKIELGQHEDAVADFDEAIRLQPQFAYAFFKRGTAKIELGLQEEAREDFEAALELARNAGDTILLDQAEQALASLD